MLFGPSWLKMQTLLLLCRADGSRDINSQELAALDTSVQAIEQKLRDIQHFIGREKQAITKARALIKACALQQDQLEYISTHLPTRLPEANSVSITAQPQPAAGISTSSKELPTEELDKDENADTTNVEAQPAAARQTAGDKKKRAKAPRRSVSAAVRHCQSRICSRLSASYSQHTHKTSYMPDMCLVLYHVCAFLVLGCPVHNVFAQPS